MVWYVPTVHVEHRKVYGLLKVDWHARDGREIWNKNITSYYMMAQGVTYGYCKFNPTAWRGLLDFDYIYKIEPFPRRDFDKIR
jgi:hypothetical protein